MKRFYIIPLVWVLTVVVVSAQSTDPITNVLLQIADHNPEVREARLAAEAAKQESGAGNNLADPTVSYTRQWGKPEGATSEVITELEVLQSFDFPTAYIQRNKLHNLQKTVFDSEAEAVRQRVLLQAKELCIDIIALRQTQVLLRRRLEGAKQLSDIYIHRLEAGDVGIVDVNKIRLELLNTQTAYDLNAQDIQSRLNELRQLNGGEPISFEATEYPQESLPATDREAWKTEMLARSADVQAAVHRESAAKQAIGVQQTNGLPKFDIGFKRDTEPSTPYNGVVVGISIPLFSNRHQVKRARAEWQAAGARRELAVTTETAAVDRLWEEAETLRGVLQSYERELRDSETIELLRLALDGGELSMINYLGEISVLYDMRTTYIELQARYRKALAQLNKGML